eukprot:6085960-Alexandrium_andersonii.AAC.1
MSASLVGSEMCIRDRRSTTRSASPSPRITRTTATWTRAATTLRPRPTSTCLLYTSDAADDM